MQKKNINIAIILVLSALTSLGCGGGDFNGSGQSIAQSGAAGQPAETGGTGGNGTGGQLSGTGGGLTGGTGGVTGGTGATNTGGTGGVCVPKTCETIAAELTGYDPTSGLPFPQACGVVADGCGGFKDCTNPALASNGGCEQGFAPGAVACTNGVCTGTCMICVDSTCAAWPTEGCGYQQLIYCPGVTVNANTPAPNQLGFNPTDCTIRRASDTSPLWCC